MISDAIVDTLKDDPLSRVGVETLTTTNLSFTAGEVRGAESIDHDVLKRSPATRESVTTARLPLA